MYTLLPAMRNVSVPLLMQAVEEMNQYYSEVQFGHHIARFIRILQRSKTLSAQEKQTMQDNLIEYDSLIDDNPDIQKRVAKGETRGAQEMVTALVEVRFPQLVEVAQRRVSNIQSVEMLKQLTKQIATASDEKTALWVLNSYAA